MEKALVLKTVDNQMKAYGRFIWPKSGRVVCPDWIPDKDCGHGLHGLLWGEGDCRLLNLGGNFLVLEVDSANIIDLEGKVKFPECNVVYCGDMYGAAEIILRERPESKCVGSGREYVHRIGYFEYCFINGVTRYIRKPNVLIWFDENGKRHSDTWPACNMVEKRHGEFLKYKARDLY